MNYGGFIIGHIGDHFSFWKINKYITTYSDFTCKWTLSIGCGNPSLSYLRITMSIWSDVCLAVCCNITGAKHCTNNVRPNGVYLVYCLFCKQLFILPHSNTTTRAITASIPSQRHTTTRKVTPPLL